MSTRLLLLLQFLSLSSYSCNARDLRAFSNDPTRDVEGFNHNQTSVRPKPRQSLFGVLQSQQHQPMKANGRVGSASTEDSSDSEALLSRDMKGTRGAISGLENLISSSAVAVGLQKTTKLEETGRRSRSMLGSGSDVGIAAAPSKDSRESNESVAKEGVDNMDYDQPHRKPPIHNELP
ncbi:hypothetical protein AAC387_Pa08g1919 [Persea americana]